MAYEWNVVAISWQGGNYSVVGAEIFNVGIDWTTLLKSAPLRGLPLQPGYYIDEGTVITREELRPHLTSEKARGWFEGPAAKADLFLIHRGEWESGLG